MPAALKMGTHIPLVIVILTVLNLVTDKISADDNPLTCISEWEENSEVTCTFTYGTQEPNNSFTWTVESSQGHLTATCRPLQGCAYNHAGLISVETFPGGNNLTIMNVSRSMTTVSFKFINSVVGPWTFSLPVFVKPATPLCWDPEYGGPDMLIRCRTGSVYPRGKCIFHVQGTSSQDSDMLKNITYSHATRRSSGYIATECFLHIPWRFLHPGDSLQFQVEMFPSVPNGQQHSVFSKWTDPVVYEPYSVINFTANYIQGPVTVGLRSRVNFYCKATGNPKPTLYIVRNLSNQIVHQRSLVTSTYYSMLVENCGVTDHYECRISNGLGERKGVYVFVEDRLKLTSPPLTSQSRIYTVTKTSSQFVARFDISGCPSLNFYRLTYDTVNSTRQVRDWEVTYDETYFEMTLKTSTLHQIAADDIPSGYIRFTVTLNNFLQPLIISLYVLYIDDTISRETTTLSASTEYSSDGWSPGKVAALVMSLIIVVSIIVVGLCVWRVSRKKEPLQPIRPTFYPPVPTAGQRQFRPANRPANHTPENNDMDMHHIQTMRDTSPIAPTDLSSSTDNIDMHQIQATRDTSPIVPTDVSFSLPSAPPTEMDNPGLQFLSPPPSYDSVVVTDVSSSSNNGAEDAQPRRTLMTDEQGPECPPPSYASVQASLERPPSYPGHSTFI